MYAVRGGGLAATSGAVNCSDFWTWPPNIFNPNCYQITAAKLWGTPEQKAAAYAATSPEVVYESIQAPPAVKAPTGAVLTTVPESGAAAAAVIEGTLAQQMSEWQAQNQGTMEQTAANVERAGRVPGLLPAMPWGTITLVVGILAFALIAGGGGSPRRYGR